MTLADKLNELHGDGSAAYAGTVPALPNLCIPALTLNDSPGGVGHHMTGVTQLPAPVANAATWDTSLGEKYGNVIGAEQWGKGTEVDLGPTVNIVRDPRWGRAFETYGEDPYLAGQMGVADVEGIQGTGEMAQVKHLAVYNQEVNRHKDSDDAIIDQRVEQEIYLSQFGTILKEADPASVMCSYNRINDESACQDPYTLTQVLRNQWNYRGFTTSDWSGTESTVASAQAGLNMQMPNGSYYGAPLQQAVADGQVSMATIDNLVRPILTQMFRFNLFTNPPTGGPTSVVTTPAHVAVAKQVAEDGTVLLKNADNLLPLSPTRESSIAVIGDDAGSGALTTGGGSAAVKADSIVTPYQGIAARAGKNVTVQYASGTPSDMLQQAVDVAKSSDVAVVFASKSEAEGSDLPDIDLPAAENTLISAVAAVNPNTIVVLNTGSAVAMPWLDSVKGVFEAWYPGQQDGSAIAALLFGDANPSGKLPVTFPKSVSDVPASTAAQWPGVNGKVQYSEGLDVGYRWYDVQHVEPLFPFGYGLSYTTFQFSRLHVAGQLEDGGGQINVTARVTNTGQRAGDEVAQLYLTDPTASGEPGRQLKGFTKVHLLPHQSRTVHFQITPTDASYWSSAAQAWAIAPGQYTVQVGDSSRSLPLTSGFRVQSTKGPESTTVKTSAAMAPGATLTLTTTYTNGSTQTARDARTQLTLPDGWTGTASTSSGWRGVPPGSQVTTTWVVHVPATQAPGDEQLSATTRYQLGRGRPADTVANPITVQVPYPNLSSAYNQAGVTDDTNPGPGNFDGHGNSYSAQALAAVGVTPGQPIAGTRFTWPDVAAGQPDMVIPDGQVITINGSGSSLSFLGAAHNGSATGQVTVTYTDGSTSTGTVTLANWTAKAAAPGTRIVATARWNRAAGSSDPADQPVNLYSASIPLTSGKQIAYVTLPNDSQMHIFDIAIS